MTDKNTISSSVIIIKWEDINKDRQKKNLPILTNDDKNKLFINIKNAINETILKFNNN